MSLEIWIFFEFWIFDLGFGIIVILITNSKDFGCMKWVSVLFAIILLVSGVLVVFNIATESSDAQPTTIIVDPEGNGDILVFRQPLIMRVRVIR